MGFFSKKEQPMTVSRFAHFKDSVYETFSHIKQDLSHQRQWVNYLHKLHSALRFSHDQHKDVTIKNIDDMKRWIVYLNKRMERQEKYMKEVSEYLKSNHEVQKQHHEHISKKVQTLTSTDTEKILDELKDKIDRANMMTKEQMQGLENRQNTYQEHIEKLNDKHSLALKTIDKLQKRHEESQKAIQKLQERHNETLSNVDRLQEGIADIRSKPAPLISSESLTNPEQKLLNLLMNEQNPVNYATVAEKTGNSINTVRVIMNNLKKRGLVQENILPSGVKLFSATDKEKVKKLYNIKHL